MIVTLNQGRFPRTAQDRLTAAAVGLMLTGQAESCIFTEGDCGSGNFQILGPRSEILYTVRRQADRYVLLDRRGRSLAEGGIERVARLIA